MAHKQHAAPKTTDLSHSKVAARTPEARRKDRLTTTTKPHVTHLDKGLDQESRRQDALRANGAQAGVPMGLAQASQSGNNTGSGGSNSPELGTGILASQQALADEQAQQ